MADAKSLQLYSEDDKFSQAIARFNSSRKDNRTNPPGFIPATLLLMPPAVAIQDLVIASFLFLERPRRISDRSYDQRLTTDVVVDTRGGAPSFQLA